MSWEVEIERSMIYKEPPVGFSPRFEVVSCYLEHGGKFLMLHRHENKSQGDKWGVVAGKMEPGEDATSAMVREIREETSLTIFAEQLEYFTKVYVHHGGYDFVYHMFRAKLDFRLEIKINNQEHAHFKWVSPQESLKLSLVDDLDECIKVFYKLE